MNKNLRDDLLYPDLSYKIVGVLFDVYNKLGHGYQEKHYEKAVALALDSVGLKYKEQLSIPLNFDGKSIGKYFIDLLIEDKIVVELKRGERVAKGNIDQIRNYLKTTGLQLGILAQFTTNGVKFRRIVNVN